MVHIALIFFVALSVGFAAFADDAQVIQRNPKYSDRLSKESEKILFFNVRFKSPDVQKECKKEVVSDCYMKQLQEMHQKEKLSTNAIVLALPAAIHLVLLEKELKLKANPKVPQSDLNLEMHKKKARIITQFVEMACARATAKDWGFTDPALIKIDDKSATGTIKDLHHNAIQEFEQVRKYSEFDAGELKKKFNEIYTCGKNN